MELHIRNGDGSTQSSSHPCDLSSPARSVGTLLHTQQVFTDTGLGPAEKAEGFAIPVVQRRKQARERAAGLGSRVVSLSPAPITLPVC